MNPPYQILLDIWEGNPNLDLATLEANGVVGLIVRLNSMAGGHHMDDRFAPNWTLAKQFQVQTVYFVYNPWVDGTANFNWLVAHLPADFNGRRLLIDIEVKYPGYSSKTYADEVQEFMDLVAARFPQAIYTGGWFIPVMLEWPEDVDYWWGSYPYILDGLTTWAEYKSKLASLSFSGFTKSAPGKVRLWQCSGDKVKLEGFGGHAVDISVFPGTLEELKTWLCIPDGSAPKPEPLPASGIVQVTALNLRSSPGIANNVTGSLRKGVPVKILERKPDAGGNGEWLKVRAEGWVAGTWAGNEFVRAND
jgi:GH25 family lysozyme M1 (1,4-beta-N-acetylmuramidase)